MRGVRAWKDGRTLVFYWGYRSAVYLWILWGPTGPNDFKSNLGFTIELGAARGKGARPSCGFCNATELTDGPRSCALDRV